MLSLQEKDMQKVEDALFQKAVEESIKVNAPGTQEIVSTSYNVTGGDKR